ncbi:MAG: class II fumarate hydratase [Chlamydiia bacterium]
MKAKQVFSKMRKNIVMDMEFRIERDSLGEVKVPKHRLYGAQTERSLENFRVGSSQFPLEVIHQLILIKRAAAVVNHQLGVLDLEHRDLILRACDELLKGGHHAEFPLHLYQTGSGTQSNMNVNEVISNLAIQMAGGELGSKKPIHPNDHVNKSQSSNDVIPTAIHMAVVYECKTRLLPALKLFKETLHHKEKEFLDIVKVGRTHLMDATPLSLGQEFGGYKVQIEHGIECIEHALKYVEELAIGGTAVGTKLNTPMGFQELMIDELNRLTGHTYRPAKSLFEALSTEDSLVQIAGAFNRIACSVLKIANDIRFYASGPRAGLAELILPANEPGSSIMPGKVNPTQCESITMIAARVMGNYTTITIAASQGNFQLNVYRPVIAHAVLQAIEILGDGIRNFTERCVKGIQADRKMIVFNLHNSLMLVTALAPYIGYDKSAKIASFAYENNVSLKDAAVELKFLTAKEFDSMIDVEKMAFPHGKP